MAKEWAPVVGYEDAYVASTRGVVKSVNREVPGRGESTRLIRGQILCPRVRPGGTVTVNLWKGNAYEQVPVRRVVLEAHAGPRPEGMDAVNVNGNPADNRLCNLCWK